MTSLTDDEIREKYLERAIRELNDFQRQLTQCVDCPRGNATPIIGSGHPLADIVLVKFGPRPSEVEEGVAFYGRAGNALSKALRRLKVDPLEVYGTLCVKCPLPNPEAASASCISRLRHELAIVLPRLLVVMGEEALDVINGLKLPTARTLSPHAGEIQQLTGVCDAIFTPNIDNALDDDSAKRSFWQAFRSVGEWYAAQPPY